MQAASVEGPPADDHHRSDGRAEVLPVPGLVDGADVAAGAVGVGHDEAQVRVLDVEHLQPGGHHLCRRCGVVGTEGHPDELDYLSLSQAERSGQLVVGPVAEHDCPDESAVLVGGVAGDDRCRHPGRVVPSLDRLAGDGEGTRPQYQHRPVHIGLPVRTATASSYSATRYSAQPSLGCWAATSTTC